MTGLSAMSLKAFLADEDDDRHGTAYGYRRLGCRCARCRDAHRVREARNKARRVAGRDAVRKNPEQNG